MLKNLFGVSIYKEVMSILKDKIKQAQKSYEEEVSSLKEKKWFLKNEIYNNLQLKLDELQANHDIEIHNAKMRHINSILKKII